MESKTSARPLPEKGRGRSKKGEGLADDQRDKKRQPKRSLRSEGRSGYRRLVSSAIPFAEWQQITNRRFEKRTSTIHIT